MALDADQAHAQNVKIIEEFRRTGGHVGGPFEGASLLLLHTVGARSGRERTNPVMYQQVGDDYAVFGSAAGDDEDPAWFRNLVAHPDVTAEIGTETLRLRARVLDAAERDPIWERQKREQPGFADYERKTSRTIPVALLER